MPSGISRAKAAYYYSLPGGPINLYTTEQYYSHSIPYFVSERMVFLDISSNFHTFYSWVN